MRRDVGKVHGELNHMLEAPVDRGKRRREILECLAGLGAKITVTKE
jgi:hypothetical protein